MLPFRFRPKAINDLERIAAYTFEQWGEQQEREYTKLIEQSVLRICENPRIGPSYDAIYPGLRRHLVGSHILFYLVTDSTIEIVRILHSSMDVDSHL